MAGDWIKMRQDLHDDPAVVQIALLIDTEEDSVVGKLHRLWCWADKHTTDGTAPAITSKWVDRYVSKTGFADAMAKAGWISFSADGVTFPSFDIHNGQSAKVRAEASIRQRLSRKNRDEGVTGVARTSIPKPFARHVLNRDGFTCVYCGTSSDEKTEASRKAVLSIDHIAPESRGGSASVDNLVCCCRKCNSEKNDRTPEEWGLVPTFLQEGVTYLNGFMSQKKCDKSVTREEKRREDISVAKATVPPAKLPPCPHTEIIDLFAKHLPELPQPKTEMWTGSRAKALGSRWKWLLTAKKRNGDSYATNREEALAWIGRYFAYVAESDFLTGRNGKFNSCDLGWLVNEANFSKVLQGNYDNKEKVTA